jgi:hypothetical protein
MQSQQDYTVNDLEFPVIAITKSGAITVHLNRDTLEVQHVKMIRRGWYRGMTIIDFAGDSYIVRKATRVRGEGPLWGFSLIYSRRVRCELALNSPKSLALTAVKRAVCDAMCREPHLWEAGLNENGVAGWQNKIQEADNIGQVFDLLRSNQ